MQNRANYQNKLTSIEKLNIGEYCYHQKEKGILLKDIVPDVQNKYKIFTKYAMDHGVGQGRSFYNLTPTIANLIKFYRLSKSIVPEI